MVTDYKLILASNSPRRKELLAGLDIEFDIFVLDGIDESYYLSSDGSANFNSLHCDIFNFGGVTNFEIINAGSTTFTIQFEYNSKTYQFTPSEGSVTVS